VKNGFGNGLMKMSTKQAGTLDKGFELHADNALLGLQLTGDQSLGMIIVTNRSNDSSYTLHCDGVQLQSATATLFYLVVPVAGWSDGMRVDVYNEDGLVFSQEFDSSKTAYFAIDTTDCKYYRADVYDVTEGYILAIGNPIWNEP
jgi:hypothetical protein